MSTPQLVPAHDAQHLPAIRALFKEYAASIGVDLCFQNFSAELDGLPGQYAPPGGALLLAIADGHAAGCVAVRPLKGKDCEMKRLFVRPACRAAGLGRALALAALEAARVAGHRRMFLDTLASMLPALALYRSLGFAETPPYYNNPLPDVVYLKLELA
jgi:ribosomal protein S18 acetylase RimI-like enzyme